jgi:hypothetical protein
MQIQSARPVVRRSAFRSPARLLLACAVLAAGCGEGFAGGDEHGAPTMVPETEEVFRLGSVSGDSWQAFSRIVAAGFDAEAKLYLLDAGTRTVTVVDPDGGFVRTIGRGGEGPGEFRSPIAMAVLPGGRVVVSDMGHRGLLVFGEDGAFERTIPFDEGTGMASLVLAYGDEAVVYAAPGMMMAGPRGGSARPASDVPVRRLGILTEAGSEVVHRAWIPPRMDPRVTGGRGGTTLVRRPIRAFEPRLHVAVLPDGSLAVADSSSYRIHVVGAGGGVDRTLERPIAPRPVTDRERERERQRRLEELADGGGAAVTMMGPGGAQTMSPSQIRPMLEAQLEDLRFWPEIPVIQQLAADRDGRLWVRRFGDVGEPGPIEILGSDGALRAVVPAGSMEVPAAFGPDRLAAGVERDELDVQFVRVARLPDVP